MKESEMTRIEVPDMRTANQIARALDRDEFGYHMDEKRIPALPALIVHAPRDAVRRVLVDWELLRGVILGPA